ncbi:hypothetical protein M8J77_010806 [Diaphorina citri]|nr:hypothetical protein M8J77_010806 [Diaphorina citri]
MKNIMKKLKPRKKKKDDIKEEIRNRDKQREQQVPRKKKKADVKKEIRTRDKQREQQVPRKKKKADVKEEIRTRDKQREQQVNKMINFIEHEVELSIQNIEEDTKTECHVLKGKQFKEAKKNIQTEYTKKYNRLAKEKNESLGKDKRRYYFDKQDVLSSHLEEIHEIVTNRVGNHLYQKENEELLKKYLTALVLEGAYMLGKPIIFLKIRPQDKTIVESILPRVQEAYEEATFTTLTIEIMTESYLDEKGLGGVIIYSADQRIQIDNTVEERINSCVQLMEPWMRQKLMPSQTVKPK